MAITNEATWHSDGTVTLKRRSRLTGNVARMTFTATPEQFARWAGGLVAQEAFPHLDAGTREFIITGITPAEWAAAFPDDASASDDSEGDDK